MAGQYGVASAGPWASCGARHDGALLSELIDPHCLRVSNRFAPFYTKLGASNYRVSPGEDSRYFMASALG